MRQIMNPELLHLCADSTVAAVTSDKSKGAGGDVLQVLFGVSPQEAAEVVKGLLAYLPRATLSADRELENALPPTWSRASQPERQSPARARRRHFKPASAALTDDEITNASIRQ